MQPGDFSRGDLVEVAWVDIYEDPTGNPDAGDLALRHSFGLFWDYRKSHGVDAVVTTTTLDAGNPESQGYCIYPVSCIVSMKVIKRKNRKRRAKAGTILPKEGTCLPTAS